MHRILIATKDKSSLAPFAEGLAKAGAETAWSDSGASTVEAAKDGKTALVVIDQSIDDVAPKELVTRLIMVNAMMFTALITDMPEEEFHETMEGLGILAQLPPRPDAADAESLLQRLEKVMGLGR